MSNQIFQTTVSHGSMGGNKIHLWKEAKLWDLSFRWWKGGQVGKRTFDGKSQVPGPVNSVPVHRALFLYYSEWRILITLFLRGLCVKHLILQKNQLLVAFSWLSSFQVLQNEIYHKKAPPPKKMFFKGKIHAVGKFSERSLTYKPGISCTYPRGICQSVHRN